MVCGTEATDHEAEDALPSQSKETHPHLLLRGLSGAKVEIGLATMAYNLKRITTCSVQPNSPESFTRPDLCGSRAHNLQPRHQLSFVTTSRACCETQFRRWCKDARSSLVDALMMSDCARHECASSSLMKRFRQFGCTEHIRHALDVVCHRCQADFDPCA
jgi:hypothetical protein